MRWLLDYKSLRPPWWRKKPAEASPDLVVEYVELRDWLQTATRSLAISVKERIWTEVEEHYREAVTAHITEGATETDAQATALAELGDPKNAARRFHKEHLTARDVEYIEDCRKRAGDPSMLFINYACFAAWSLYHFDQPQEHMFWIAAAFVILVALPTMLFFANKSVAERTAEIFLLTRYCYNWSLILFVTLSSFSRHGHDWFFVGAFLLAVTFDAMRLLRLWRKMRRAGDDWPEMPPPNAASS